MKAFCGSVDANGVGIVLADGGDTSTLQVTTKLFALRGRGEQKTSLNCPCTQGARPHASTLRTQGGKV